MHLGVQQSGIDHLTAVMDVPDLLYLYLARLFVNLDFADLCRKAISRRSSNRSPFEAATEFRRRVGSAPHQRPLVHKQLPRHFRERYVYLRLALYKDRCVLTVEFRRIYLHHRAGHFQDLLLYHFARVLDCRARHQSLAAGISAKVMGCGLSVGRHYLHVLILDAHRFGSHLAEDRIRSLSYIRGPCIESGSSTILVHFDDCRGMWEVGAIDRVTRTRHEAANGHADTLTPGKFTLLLIPARDP